MCGLSRGRQQISQIVLKIAVVGQTRLWFGVEPDFNILVLNLKRLGESGQCAKRSFGEFRRGSISRQSQ